MTYIVTVAGTYSLIVMDVDNGVERPLGTGVFPTPLRIRPGVTSANNSRVDTGRLTGFRGSASALSVAAGSAFSIGVRTADRFQNSQEYGAGYPSDELLGRAEESIKGLVLPLQV